MLFSIYFQIDTQTNLVDPMEKYMHKKFKALLLEIREIPMLVQRNSSLECTLQKNCKLKCEFLLG
jgi:hypothetical protein